LESTVKNRLKRSYALLQQHVSILPTHQPSKPPRSDPRPSKRFPKNAMYFLRMIVKASHRANAAQALRDDFRDERASDYAKMFTQMITDPEATWDKIPLRTRTVHALREANQLPLKATAAFQVLTPNDDLAKAAYESVRIALMRVGT